MRALRSPVKAEMCAASEGLSNDLSLRVPQCSTGRQGFAILCSLCAVSCFLQDQVEKMTRKASSSTSLEIFYLKLKRPLDYSEFALHRYVDQLVDCIHFKSNPFTPC